MRTEKDIRFSSGGGGKNNDEAGSSKGGGGGEMVQASMECCPPPLRGVEFAHGKINLNKGMSLGNAQKRKISFEENVNDDKLYHNQLDEEIIHI